AAGIDDSGASRAAAWNKIDGSGACPTGFRVPTQTELQAEIATWPSNNIAGGFNSDLKWATAGLRLRVNGNISTTLKGFYWSSTADGDRAINMNYSDEGALAIGRGLGSNGLSVRCIRGSSAITVPLINIPVSSINITSPNEVLHNASLNLSGSVVPNNASDQALSWAIQGGNNSIASIDNNIIHGIFPGEVTIIATASGGANVTAEQVFTVNPVAVTSINITNAAEVLHRSTLQLSATVEPNDATTQTVSWSISGSSGIASIDNNNVLRGLAPGTVNLIATADDGSGSSQTQPFTVNPILVTSISIDSANSVINGETITLAATVLPADASNLNFTWSITAGSGLICLQIRL
ncbi:MAG: hypothetical protein HAW58_05930, partial [Candidatus Thioglobus sp.]|nr:hypothetical protein [Candidatus Thioglobus sp.]